MEQQTGRTGTVGAGIPGSISGITGLVKNANSTWLNGRPLDKDLSRRLNREVRVANDANCLAVSEATDGAAAGKHVVFGVILGTGCGGGVAIGARVHTGPNGVAGEWGHNPLPWPKPEEYPGPLCYCGKRGCMEMWVSGTGIALDYKTATGATRTTHEIVSDFEAARLEAVAVIERFEDRLARGLAQVINILDPDVIVIGGGVSRVQHIYHAIPKNCRPMSSAARFRPLSSRRSSEIRAVFAVRHGSGRSARAITSRMRESMRYWKGNEAVV